MTARARRRVAQLCFAAHVGAVALTLTALAPGLPPAELAARDAFMTAHAARWAAGWIAWVLATVMWMLFVRAWDASLPAVGGAGRLALVATVAGGLLDSAADVAWARLHDALAMRMMGSGTVLYVVGGGLLTRASVASAAFPRWLVLWSIVVWIATAALSAAALAADGRLVRLTSTALFPIFLPWMLAMGYGWLGRESR
jgi:hypothetical protein